MHALWLSNPFSCLQTLPFKFGNTYGSLRISRALFLKYTASFSNKGLFESHQSSFNFAKMCCIWQIITRICGVNFGVIFVQVFTNVHFTPPYSQKCFFLMFVENKYISSQKQISCCAFNAWILNTSHNSYGEVDKLLLILNRFDCL